MGRVRPSLSTPAATLPSAKDESAIVKENAGFLAEFACNRGAGC